MSPTSNIMLDLDELYKEAMEDCGKNPSKELIRQEFLALLKEKGELFLRQKE